MEWVKLSTSYDTDDAIMRAGEAAEVLFTRALAYCGREETGGFIPDGMPERICPKRAKSRVAALIREQLWARDDARCGWQIRSWDVWQSELDILAARRRSERERKRRERQKRADEAKRLDQVSRDVSRDKSETSRDSHVTRPEVSSRAPARAPASARPRETEKERTTTTGSRSSYGRTAPEEAPPTEAEPTRIENLITAYRDMSPRGIPDKLASQLANEIHGIIASGFTDSEILHGLCQLRPRKLGPGALAALVDELANSTGTPAAHPRRGDSADIQPVIIGDGQAAYLTARSREDLAMQARMRELDAADAAAGVDPATAALMALNATARPANGGPQ